MSTPSVKETLSMPDISSIDVVRSRFPSTPANDAAELKAHAQHLGRLRDQLRVEDLRGLEIAVTFDPRGGGPDG